VCGGRFDECHKAKNVQKDETSSSKVAQCVLKLQKQLPLARVVYASATGVAEVSDLAFMTRLGLWGDSTSFSNFDMFGNAMMKRGLGGLEVLAMELKSSGRFVARGLSWEGAEFEMIESILNDNDRRLYDTCADWWADLRAAMETACEETKDKRGVKAFWGAHLRFFRALITAIKVPFVIEQCKEALRNGHCAVIGLQSTGEASLNYAAEQMNMRTGDEVPSGELLSPTYWSARRFLEEHFPIRSLIPPSTLREMEKEKNERDRYQRLEQNELLRRQILHRMQNAPDGSTLKIEQRQMYAQLQARMEEEQQQYQLQQQQQQAQQATYNDGVAAAAVDQINAQKERDDEEQGALLEHLVQIKETLLSRLNQMKLPTCALDTMIDRLGGPSNVAEMTGRSRRVVRHSRTNRFVLDQRQSEAVNLREKDAFMNGKRNVAIISDAASTGISLHSGLSFPNQRRRVHITLELPWSATKAIQQLGRTHRSHQKTAPIYKLITTNLGGERRFVSAVATRLESLGALTRGDRRAASGADLSASSILKSKYGMTGLRKLQEHLSSILPHDQLQQHQKQQQDQQQQQHQQHQQHQPPQRALLPSCIDAVALGRDVAISSGQPDRVLDIHEIVDCLRTGHRRTFIEVKDHGKINMFLNRLTALPVAYQNALFEAFASCVSAEVSDAKMRDKYDEGVPEIKASKIIMKSVEDVTDRMRAAIITIDRGSSYQDVVQRRAGVGGGCGDFYLSNHYDKTSKQRLIMFASKVNGRQSFALTRPNLGKLRTEMSASDLRHKYTILEEGVEEESGEEDGEEDEEEEGLLTNNE
jgi:hypothetical protein